MSRLKRSRFVESEKESFAEEYEKKLILVVDDSYSTREIEKSILELENYDVVTACDGIDGLEKLADHHFDLIITDIKMPRMDGLAFVENIRQRDEYRQIPVIVVSSVEDADVKEKFVSKGADSYIYKSDFDRGNLVHEVKRLIQ
ncbi:MAG: response regulator [Desulfobacteraceae bacterium]|nr:response regulator [Desulfobacteraceae bacterium]